MGFTENGSGLSAADVAAVMNGNNPGWGFGDQNGWWVLLLFLFAMNGNGFGGFGGGGAAPFLAANGDMQRGFDQQATISAINGVQQSIGNGFADAAVARCQGNAAITAAITNGTAGITNTLTQNQMGLYQTLNANQNANTQGMNSLAMALQQCLKKVLNRAKENFHANFAVGTCMA